MPAIWRPNVRGELLDVDVEVKATEEEVRNKGTKRKRAPPTKGPCEHGVKYRSNCKVCSACPHGKRRSQCKECGGGSICEHGRIRARSSLQGVRWVWNLRARSSTSQCKECALACKVRSAVESASTVVSALVQGVRWGLSTVVYVVYMQGVRWVSNLRARSSAL